MESFKSISILILTISLFASCSSAQKLQNKAPMNYEEVYFEKWVSGVKEGGSGINLFIPISSEIPNNVKLDSVYFRGKSALLEMIEGEKTLFVGRFITNFNQKQTIILNSDPTEEYANNVSILEEEIPFDLKNSECVISYKEGNETKYFKIENIIEKQPQYYPSAPNGQ